VDLNFVVEGFAVTIETGITVKTPNKARSAPGKPRVPAGSTGVAGW
jgi:hypothetical protein